MRHLFKPGFDLSETALCTTGKYKIAASEAVDTEDNIIICTEY